jgi:hypothetical protein
VEEARKILAAPPPGSPPRSAMTAKRNMSCSDSKKKRFKQDLDALKNVLNSAVILKTL